LQSLVRIILDDHRTSLPDVLEQYRHEVPRPRMGVERPYSQHYSVEALQRRQRDLMIGQYQHIVTHTPQCRRNLISSAFNIANYLSFRLQVNTYRFDFGRVQNGLYRKMIVGNQTK